MTTPTPREALAEQDRAWILAQNFHRLYEMLAPSFGYETRADTRAFVADSPNGKLMRAVCTQLIAKGHLSAALAAQPLAVQPVRMLTEDELRAAWLSAEVRPGHIIELMHETQRLFAEVNGLLIKEDKRHG